MAVGMAAANCPDPTQSVDDGIWGTVGDGGHPVSAAHWH